MKQANLIDGAPDEEEQMMKMMGIGDFNTTKGTGTKSNKSKTVIPKSVSGELEKENTTGIEPKTIKPETKNSAL